MTSNSKVTIDQKAANKVIERVQKKLIAVGYQIERDIKKSFSIGNIKVYSGRRVVASTHIPSKEGQPPAIDTGRLKASITTNWTGSGIARVAIERSFTITDMSGSKSKVKMQITDAGVGEPRGNSNEFKVVVGTNVRYAPYLEFGTRFMGRRPFLTPIFESYKPKLISLIGENAFSGGVVADYSK